MITYDTIVIGGGVAGYSTAIYAGRFNLKTLIIAKKYGGLLQHTHVVENYPGYRSISGYELIKKFEEHVKDYNADLVEEEAIEIERKGLRFVVKTNKNKYIGKTIVFATGSERKRLDIQGEKRFLNHGLSYCALCDGPIYRNKIVGVIGGSDSAAKESLLLSEYAKKVYIIYRKEKIRAEPINIDRIKNNKKIKIINNTNVLEIKGDKFVKSIVLDRAYNKSKELKLDGLFVEIGQILQSGLASKLGVNLNKENEIIIDENSKTNLNGVYAAGDVTNIEFKQAITGAAQGVTAAFSIHNFLKKGH